MKAHSRKAVPARSPHAPQAKGTHAKKRSAIHPRLTTYLWLSAFAAAMAFMESAVVVYLRELYHPAGFHFPLLPIPLKMALTELCREVATVVIILQAAWLAGKNPRERFAAFAYLFGLWDIFYYLWLNLLISWPTNPLDPDILFLIPVPWVGPVLAPILVAFFLMGLALTLHPPSPNTPIPKVGAPEWALLLGGAALILWTFMEANARSVGFDMSVVYPDPYRWEVYGIGYSMGLIALVSLTLQHA